MALPAALFIAGFSAIQFPVIFAFFRKQGLIGAASISLMLGIMAMGVLAFIITPNAAAVTDIAFGYAPHAFNLILWPVASLAILLSRFGSAMLVPVLAFLYGLDEVIWNLMAVFRYGPFGGLVNGQILGYMLTPFWQEFYLAMAAATGMGYFIVRPKIKFNVSIPTVGAFMVVWAIAGIPAGGLTIVSLVWEIGWQAVFWFFIYASVFKR